MTLQFKLVHPYVSFFYYICVLIALMMLTHPLFLITVFFLLMSLNILQGNRAILAKSMVYFSAMGLIILILNPLFVRRGSTILFYFRDNPVTLESVVYGGTMALTLISILILFLSFNNVIHSRKFLYLFRKLWPQLALLIMITMRFVPLFIKRWKDLYDTQKQRGHSMTQGSIKARSITGMQYMQKLLTWSLEDSMQMADSMKARGFGQAKRSSYQVYQMNRNDWISLIYLGLLTACCVWGAINGAGILTIYPELGALSLDKLSYLVYGLFILLVSFPIILEGGDQLRWTILSLTK